jgi:hypothetical protein
MMMRTLRSRRDPVVFGSILAVCLIVVGFLWLISRNADSAGVAGNVLDVDPTPYSASEQCQNWATYWTTDSGVNVPPTALEAISNCRQTVDGSWIVPANAADARLARPVTFTDDEQAQIQTLENKIQGSIDRFEMFESSKLKQAIGGKDHGIYDPLANGVDGHLIDGRAISNARNLYKEEMNTFLEAPGNEALAAYTEWIVGYRQAAFNQFMAGCSGSDFDYLRAACSGTGDSLSVNYVPWTWDLSDSLLLDTYLRAVLDGNAPAPSGFTPYG